MAQHGIRRSGQHGRHPPPVRTEHTVTDRVHTAMNPMNATPGKPRLDCLPGEPHRDQLPQCDDPVLALGKLRDPSINLTRRQFPLHARDK
jgi:hypothetical protein